MITLGIMQPYIFPYIGYFQLINAVDKFIIYDDVNYIKQGWINRNYILVNKQSFCFTIPLENPSSFQLICETQLNKKFYRDWANKFIKTIDQNYKKAPFFEAVSKVVKEVLLDEKVTIAELALSSIKLIVNYLNIGTVIEDSSSVYENAPLKSQARVLDICKKESAKKYINPIGGTELYSKETFEKEGISLNFIKSASINYQQFRNPEFVPWLSIIDVLMFNDKAKVSEFLNNYDLL